MSTLLSEKAKKSSYISRTLLVLTILIGLIALVEKGPLVPGIPVGASPTSPLPLGTLRLFELLSRNYTVYMVLDYNKLDSINGEICVFTTVSPEKPFTIEESLEIVNNLKSKCRRVKLLIADETVNSNNLLVAVNSSIRVNGDRILVLYEVRLDSGFGPLPIVYSGYYYPKAIIHVIKDHSLTLDKASSVTGGIQVGYVQMEDEAHPEAVYLLKPSGELIQVRSGVERVAVASREVVNETEVLVIGDGSIFLNQVLDSNRTEYRVFVEDVFQYLCEGRVDCAIALDAVHYPTVSLNTSDALSYLVSQAMKGDIRSILYTAVLVFPIILHPSTWLPPLLVSATDAYLSFLGFPMVKNLFLLALMLFIYDSFLRNKTTARDNRLEEQREEEIGIFAELRKDVFTRKIKPTARDYISVYSVLDEVAQLLWSARFEDPVSLEKLGELLGDRERAVKTWTWSVKLYMKASGRRRLPIVLFWGRAVEKLVEFTSEFLEKLVDKYGAEYTWTLSLPREGERI